MSDGMLGFIGGILAAIIATVLASVFQYYSEIKRQKVKARLDAYFDLLELSQRYFWVTAAEYQGEMPRVEIIEDCKKISWRLADKLRTMDDVDHLEEILIVLFSDSISTAKERADRLEKLLDQYDLLVNPRYARTIRRISNENILAYGSGKIPKTNAPGNLGI